MDLGNVAFGVESTHLAENSVAYPTKVQCRPDTCRSLTLDYQSVAGPARGTTGQERTFNSDANQLLFLAVNNQAIVLVKLTVRYYYIKHKRFS